MPLCENCRKIIIDPRKLTKRPRIRPQGITGIIRDNDQYATGTRSDFYPDFPALKKSGDASCGLCISLRKRILQDFQEKPPQMRGSKASLDAEFWPEEWNFADDEEEDTEKGEWNGELEILATVGNLVPERLIFKIWHPEHVIMRRIDYDIQADEHSPAKTEGLVRYRPLCDETLSERNLDLIERWIRICRRDHKYCSDNHEMKLPTRVIDVGPSDGSKLPYLMITHGKSGRYVALSHCWGLPTISKPHFKTETHNIDERMAGMTLDTMPQNFHDAITVTRKSGLKYLWIDSLCIIQDDSLDWAREAAKMDRVYANAYLTIAATSSSSTHEGFLRRPKPNVVRMPYISPDDGTAKGHFYLDSGPGGRSTDLVSSTWNTRGWTFQERILSARILHFCKERLLFECKGADFTEDNQSPSPMQQAQWLKRDVDDQRMSASTFVPKEEPQRTYHHWYDMIRRYTEREFTYEDDLIPAVQGLINEVKSMIGDECYWGTWRGTFERGLLWCRPDGELYSSSFTKPKKPRAPTWSWLSVNGGVTWSRPPYDLETSFSLKVLNRALDDAETPADAWELRLLGKLKVLSPCVRQAWKTDHDWQVLLYCNMVEIGKGFLDKKECDFEQREIWILEVENTVSATMKSRGGDTLAGLLLEKCPGSGGSEDKFERIGFALRPENSTIFDDVEPGAFLLV